MAGFVTLTLPGSVKVHSDRTGTATFSTPKIDYELHMQATVGIKGTLQVQAEGPGLGLGFASAAFGVGMDAQCTLAASVGHQITNIASAACNLGVSVDVEAELNFPNFEKPAKPGFCDNPKEFNAAQAMPDWGKSATIYKEQLAIGISAETQGE